MRKRADVFGAVEYTDAVLRGVPRGFSIAVMLKWGSKDSLKAIEKLAASKLFSQIDVPLAKFDYDHKYPIDKLLGSVIADAKRVEQLARKYPGVRFCVSPFWEHLHPANKMGPIFEKLKAAAPTCGLINCIIGKGERVVGIQTELHLENSKPRAYRPGDIISTDGFGGKGTGNIADADVPTLMSKHSQAECFAVWSFGMNGKFGYKDKRKIEERDDYASAEYLTGHCQLLSGREGPVTFGKKMLLKAFADDHDEASWKDNKLLALLPWKDSKAEVLDSKGKVIDRLERVLPDYKSGDDLNGNARYYSKRYAYQVAGAAKKNTGTRLIRIRVGANVTPVTDGVHRSSRFK